jgi:hypothetical protein
MAIRLRPATREERQLALLWSAATVSAIVLRPFWVVVAPWLRPCVFRGVTGIPCPTCGTTRTVLALLDGDVLSALAANPLATAAGIFFAVGGLAAGLWALLRWPTPVVDGSKPRRWLLLILAAVAANWVYLIVAE